MKKKTAARQEKRPPAASTKSPGKKADPRHWIIITDHRKAHIYQKTPKGIQRIPDECLCCSKPLPGDEVDDASFLHDLASWLDAVVKEKACDRIALIASPEAMKRIHPLLGKHVHGHICAALERDIAEITEDEIEDHLTEVVWL